MQPEHSPIQVPTTYCYACSKEMRHVIESMPTGKFLRVVYICDGCECAFSPSRQYHMGEYIPRTEFLQKYKKPEEVPAPGTPQEQPKLTEAPVPTPAPSGGTAAPQTAGPAQAKGKPAGKKQPPAGKSETQTAPAMTESEAKEEVTA